LKHRHDPDAGQIEGAGKGPVKPVHEQGGETAEPPQNGMAPVEVAPERRIVHERVADAPIARSHQIAGMGQPGIGIVVQKEPRGGEAGGGIDHARIEGAGGAVRVEGEASNVKGDEKNSEDIHPSCAETADRHHGKIRR